MYVFHTCARCLQRPEESVRSWSSTGDCEFRDGGAGNLNLVPQEEQQIFLSTEPLIIIDF